MVKVMSRRRLWHMRVCLSWDGGRVAGLLDDCPTSRLLWEKLPIIALARDWGNEVFFEVPLDAVLDTHPKVVVPRGTICYWVQGSCVAIPFGPTPVSEGKECRLVTAANVLGRLDGDGQELASISEGDWLTLDRY
jgi:uncharacterized protein